MAAVIGAVDEVGAERTAPEHPGGPSLSAGTTIVLVASGLLSLNRFGGLVAQAPRAFFRLSLVVVWGWIGLSVLVWATARTIGTRTSASPSRVLAVTGGAHVSLAALAIVLFVAAGALQLRWPGLIAAAVVIGYWLPAKMVAGAADVFGTRTGRAILAVAPAYALWLATVGRHLHEQLGHLI